MTKPYKISFISQDMPQDAVELTNMELQAFLEDKYSDYIYIDNPTSNNITDLNTGATFVIFGEDSAYITQRVNDLMEMLEVFFKKEKKQIAVHEYRYYKNAHSVVALFFTP
jgi:hypothetical protein